MHIAVIHRSACLTLAWLRQKPVDNLANLPASANAPAANFSEGGEGQRERALERAVSRTIFYFFNVYLEDKCKPRYTNLKKSKS